MASRGERAIFILSEDVAGRGCLRNWCERLVFLSHPNLTSKQLFHPAFPYVGPGVGDDVCTQVPAPCGERSVKDTECADHYDLFPTLIAMHESEEETLPDDRCHNASCQGMELALQVTASLQLFAKAGGDRYQNPKQNFRQTLRQQCRY